MSNTKTLPLEDIMGISKSWLEEQIKDVNNGKITATKLLQDILRGGNLFPIKPIVE